MKILLSILMWIGFAVVAFAGLLAIAAFAHRANMRSAVIGLGIGWGALVFVLGRELIRSK